MEGGSGDERKIMVREPQGKSPTLNPETIVGHTTV